MADDIELPAPPQFDAAAQDLELWAEPGGPGQNGENCSESVADVPERPIRQGRTAHKAASVWPSGDLISRKELARRAARHWPALSRGRMLP